MQVRRSKIRLWIRKKKEKDDSHREVKLDNEGANTYKTKKTNGEKIMMKFEKLKKKANIGGQEQN